MQVVTSGCLALAPFTLHLPHTRIHEAPPFRPPPLHTRHPFPASPTLLSQVHAGNGEWLQRARNFTGAHAVVECGGYGFVSLNDSAPLDIGGGSPSCCFGRGGPVVYANETRLHLREARAALRAEAASQAAMAARAAADDGGDGGEGAGGRGEEERGGRGEGGGEEGSGGRGEWGSETGAGRVEDGGGGGAREGGVGDGCVGGSMPHASAEAGGGGVGREEAATGSMADAARAGAETAEAARTAAAVGPAVTSAAAVTDGLAEAVTAAAAAAAAEREAAVESLRYLHTGSQWVVLDRAFCHYLITDTRAIRWRKVGPCPPWPCAGHRTWTPHSLCPNASPTASSR